MAIEFARVEYVKRSDGGNACRSAAYNARTDLRCERTGERFYFAHRDGLAHHEVMLPAGAAERFRDIAVLWNAAQAAERRKDSQEARELLLALPSDPEMGLEDWRALTAEFAEVHFVSKGVAVQIDIHAPHEGETNVHAHLLITTRRLEGEGFASAKARDLDPEVRTGRAGRPIVAEAEQWGALWRDFQNAYFERRGLDLRVDETGIVAQRHEGPKRQRTVPQEAQARAHETDEANAAASRDPVQILAAVTRQRATFTELDLERQLRKHIGEAAERQALREAVLARDEVLPLHEREDGEFTGRYTIRAVRDEEERVLRAAAAIAAKREAIAERHRAAAAGRGLDPEQQAAFLKATGTDGLVLIEGLAGTGKSYSIAAIREAHEAAGWRVIGLAPTNTVADDLRRGGFGHGSTVHLELFWQENGRHDRAPAWDRRTCVVVDEAAMLDTRVYARLMQHAADTRAKVVLVGDDRQLPSVERGGMFTALKERHGSSVIARVRRQDEDWQRGASEEFAAGRMAEGLRSYAERGFVHWSGDLEESRIRLLSDWDQDSRQRPEVARFVYASTNVEANALNREIRDIRARRGEVAAGLAVETVRGAIEIGAGDRIQFFANDRKAGLYNGTLGTVRAVEGTQLAVETDTGRQIRFDAAEFKSFGLGYAGTVYRGQGKTQTEVYALYDSPFAWNARTAYVGMTRHKENINLYVAQELARDEPELARQMSRRMRDEASLAYATAAEVVELRSRRPGPQEMPAAASPPPATAAKEAGLPRDAAAALKRIDLTAYAREVHGYAVQPVPRSRGQYELRRIGPDGAEERLEARRADDGRWMWRNPVDPRERGDIIDLAKREGAADLAVARRAVSAYAKGRSSMPSDMPHWYDDDQPSEKAPGNLTEGQRAAPQQASAAGGPKEPGPTPSDMPNWHGDEDEPSEEGDLKNHNSATNARRSEEARDPEADADDTDPSSEEEARLQVAREEEAKRQAFFTKQEAARKARLEDESRQTEDREQALLALMQRIREQQEAFIAVQTAKAATARRELSVSEPAQSRQAGDQDAFPESAALRYSQALARHYDAANPFGSLANTALAEGAAYQRDRYQLDRKIALEADPARREMLQLRRDIEEGDHFGQVWGRIAGQSRSFHSTAHDAEAVKQGARAEEHREAARDARHAWEERAVEHPALYPPLDEAMRERIEAARKLAPPSATESPKEAAKDAPKATSRSDAADVPNWYDDDQQEARVSPPAAAPRHTPRHR